MDTMYNHCHDKFSEYFAFQAILFCSIGRMNAKNTLKLFENKLYLPSESVKRENNSGWQYFGWGIGYKQSPIAQCHMIFAWSTAFLFGVFAQLSAPCICNLLCGPKADETTWHRVFVIAHDDIDFQAIAGRATQGWTQVDFLRCIHIEQRCSYKKF